MVKLQETKGRYFLSVPKEYVKLKKWKKGTELVFGFDHQGRIIIEEISK